MALQLWTSGDLYRVITDTRLDPIPSYFLDNFFPNTFFSKDREIIIDQLPASYRRLAPFVLPTEQGKPIFVRRGETVKSLTPPYIKPKDAVRAVDVRAMNPSEILRAGGPPSIEQRFDARVVEIQEFHRRAIRMQEAWMAARAIIDGGVQINYERDQGAAWPSVYIDFGRAAGHTVSLVGTFWDDPDYPIYDDIQAWMDTMRLALYGGSPTELLVGAAVAPIFRKNKQVIAQLNTLQRGTDASFSTGLIRYDNPRTRLGTLGAGLEVYAYKDTVEDNSGAAVDILDPKSVLLLAPGVEGVKCYGAIFDIDAMQGGQALSIDIFPKMFKTEDPGELYIMNQCSPLPIPMNPNRTFKARVLA